MLGTCESLSRRTRVALAPSPPDLRPEHCARDGAPGSRSLSARHFEEPTKFVVRCISMQALIQTTNQRAAKEGLRIRASAYPAKSHLSEVDSRGLSLQA